MNFRTNKKSGKAYPVLKGFSKPMRFTRDNVLTIPDKTGVYVFYNDPGAKPIYAGRTIDKKYSGLHHRVLSYLEKDSREEHPTKFKLRPHIKYVSYKITTEDEARRLEMKLKQTTKYNADNLMNEEKKRVSHR